MHNLSEVEKAYLAGFIDNEACITVTRFKSRSKLWAWDFVNLLIIGNANKSTVEYLRRLVGVGSISKVKKSKVFTASYKLSVSTKACRDILEAIRPYMVRQREILDLVLRFPFVGKSGCRNKRTKEQYTEQVSCHERIVEFPRYEH